MKDDDIWVVTPGTKRSTVTRFTETPERETAPEFSPDGRWLAYGSNQTGREQVYLRPYPGPGAPTPVSVNSGWIQPGIPEATVNCSSWSGPRVRRPLRPGTA